MDRKGGRASIGGASPSRLGAGTDANFYAPTPFPAGRIWPMGERVCSGRESRIARRSVRAKDMKGRGRHDSPATGSVAGTLLGLTKKRMRLRVMAFAMIGRGERTTVISLERD